jgi:hypothetical protein
LDPWGSLAEFERKRKSKHFPLDQKGRLGPFFFKIMKGEGWDKNFKGAFEVTTGKCIND